MHPQKVYNWHLSLRSHWINHLFPTQLCTTDAEISAIIFWLTSTVILVSLDLVTSPLLIIIFFKYCRKKIFANKENQVGFFFLNSALLVLWNVNYSKSTQAHLKDNLNIDIYMVHSSTQLCCFMMHVEEVHLLIRMCMCMENHTEEKSCLMAFTTWRWAHKVI